jgi:hypothetical protein
VHRHGEQEVVQQKRGVQSQLQFICCNDLSGVKWAKAILDQMLELREKLVAGMSTPLLSLSTMFFKFTAKQDLVL